MSGAELIAVLGITSSVVQIVDACSKIIDRIQAFRQSLAFQDLAVQLPLLINVIESLSTPKYRELLDESTKQALARVLEGCLRQLRRLEKLIQSMTPLEAASKFEKTWKGIRSFGKDTKLREILGALTEYKSTITLHLSSVNVQKGQNPSISSDHAKSYFDVPSTRLSHFVGRSDVFNNIQNALDSSSIHPAVTVLTGIGGQGKTQVAIEFCHRSAYNFKGIFWVDSSSESSAIRSFEKILKSLKGEVVSGESRDAKASVKDLLRSWKESWLLVFDNYDNPTGFQTLATFFPGSNSTSKSAILVTTRHISCARLGTGITLTGLSEEEGLELLLSRSSTSSRSDLSSQELHEAKDIVKRLGYLALAIDQAAAYISIRQLPLHMFIEHFQARKEFILKTTPQALWEYRMRTLDDSNDLGQNLSVLTTWELSFAQIPGSDEERLRVGDFLTQAAFFDPGAITENLFSNFHQSEQSESLLWRSAFLTDGSWDSFQFQDVVVSLVNLSLLQGLNISSDGVAFSLHPLIKDWLQLRGQVDGRQKRTSTAIAMTSSLIQSFDREKLSFQTRQGLLAHIDACLDNCSHYLTSDESLIIYGGFLEGFQTTFATFYGEHDRYKDAEKLFLKSLSLQQQKLGYENIATLSTLNNLGALYLEARQLERAKANLELALQVKETMLGPDHPRTLNSVNNMGNLLTLQTNYDGARQMYQRTLEGYSKINGAMHKTVFESLNNLGEVAMKKGDFPEAEQIFKKAFTMARTLSGDKDDSLVLYLASNVALVYKLQHKYQEALQIYSDVVTGRERLVGAEHSSTLQSMCEVADVYTILGDEASANEWYHKGNASPERRERGKLGATMETEPKLTISRANDNPTENLTPSAPAAGQSSSLPLHRDSQNDDVTQLIHEDDQMEWESLPQSKPAMTSSPSIVSQDFLLRSCDTSPGNSQLIDSAVTLNFQQGGHFASPTHPNMSTYRSGVEPGGWAGWSSESWGSSAMELETTSQAPFIDRVGFSYRQQTGLPVTPAQAIDRVGVPLTQQASPPSTRSIDRVGLSTPQYIERSGRLGMNNPPPQYDRREAVHRWGWPSANIWQQRSARATDSAPECEFIARGGVCMHNVNHMR